MFGLGCLEFCFPFFRYPHERADKMILVLLDFAKILDLSLRHIKWGIHSRFANADLHIAQRCLWLCSFVSGMLDQIMASILQSDTLTDMLSTKPLKSDIFMAHETAYRLEKPGWFRLVIAHPFHWLDEAMTRIPRAIHCHF